MTVANENNISGPYNGNGVTTVFNYSFKIYDQAHIQVIKTDAAGAETVLVIGTNYTVSGVGADVGGNVTLLVALPTGQTLTMIRKVPFTQGTDLENQGAYYADTVERALDLATMRDQELSEQLERVVKVGFGEAPQKFPPPENDMVLGWGNDGILKNVSPAEFINDAGFATAAQGVKADGAVRFDTEQGVSFEQKAQGRENVGLENIVPDANGTVSHLTYASFYEGTTVLNVTYGGGQSAVGSVLSVNGLQFGVPNYIADPTVLSTHSSRDHVGQFVFMQGAQETQVIPALGTTYTATYIQNAAIVASDNLKVGMVIDTDHVPKWSGVIASIDDVLHRAIVSAWYLVDGSMSTGTPANGVGAKSNPTTKLFGGNTAVWFGKGNSQDVDGHGHELDLVFWRAGLGVYYGWDCVIYGDHQPATVYAGAARWGGGTARFTGGWLTVDTMADGAFPSVWQAGGDHVQPYLKTRVGADTLYTVNAAGKRNADRVDYVKTAVDLTVNATGTCVVICTNAAGTINITLPAFGGFNNGRLITVVTLGAGSAAVKKPSAVTINTLATGEFQDVISDGTDWLPVKSGPVV